MKIVFLDAKTVGDVPNLHLFENFGEVVYYQTTSPQQTAERMKEADIVITNKVVLDSDAIEQASRLKLICISATGTNNVDKAAALKRGIPVKNVADYSSNSVAQGTFALLLHLLNNVPYLDAYVKNGGYSQSDIFTHLDRSFWELKGKRFGIIGLGSIGRKVATIAEAFGANVVYYSASGQNYQQPYQRLGLEELLRTSDVVSVHAPLNDYTANLLTYDRLHLMKRSAFLINAGRGGIVNEADLARALDEGLIAGAGVDVFEKEPISAQNPLLHIRHKERLAMTPHSIWASIESRTVLVEKVAQNIQQFIQENALLAKP
jgi:lactate dehydrogenase-like 2-hydroxyacid dehydrogenase